MTLFEKNVFKLSISDASFGTKNSFNILPFEVLWEKAHFNT